MVETRKEVKEIANYKVRLKSRFDKEKEDLIFLDVFITPELQEIIKQVIVPLKTSEDTYRSSDSTTQKFVRYKVKQAIFNGLFDEKQILFAKELVDNGEMALAFENVSYLDKIINTIKEQMKNLIQLVTHYTTIDTTINYNLNSSR